MARLRGVALSHAPVFQSRGGPGAGRGGASGLAFHAAALAALEIDLGWDPRTAGVVVGTSAGAVAAMMLRLGVSGADLAAFNSKVPQRADSSLISEGVIASPRLPPARWRDLIPAPGLNLGRYWWSAWNMVRLRPVPAWANLLGSGRVDLYPFVAFADEVLEAGWPAGDTRICTARASDHALSVWDGSEGVPISRAVTASCSVPGYASGVELGGVDHIDGGVRSSTNADVLVASDVGLIVVVAPMAPLSRVELGTGRLVAARTDHHLKREVDALERAGKEVVVLRSPPGIARASTSITGIGAEPARGTVGEGLVAVGGQLDRLRQTLRGRRRGAA